MNHYNENKEHLGLRTPNEMTLTRNRGHMGLGTCGGKNLSYGIFREQNKLELAV